MLEHIYTCLIAAPYVYTAGHLAVAGEVGKQSVAYAPITQWHPLHGNERFGIVVVLILEEVFIVFVKADAAVVYHVGGQFLGFLQVGVVACASFPA